jgi:hypothetical protein
MLLARKATAEVKTRAQRGTIREANGCGVKSGLNLQSSGASARIARQLEEIPAAEGFCPLSTQVSRASKSGGYIASPQ